MYFHYFPYFNILFHHERFYLSMADGIVCDDIDTTKSNMFFHILLILQNKCDNALHTTQNKNWGQFFDYLVTVVTPLFD